MSHILFECDVTEFVALPKKENDENCFSINDKCLVINLMDTQNNTVIIQTEIEKESAIELAKLILFKYCRKTFNR